MKRYCFHFGVALALLLMVSACGSGNSAAADAAGGDAAAKPAYDQTDPAQVLELVFAVAAGKSEAKLLGELCDPKGENDGDTRRICDNAKGFDPGGEFAMFFKEGKVKGAPRIEGDAAEVDFLFGPNGDEEETMSLVRRDDKWYLSDF